MLNRIATKRQDFAIGMEAATILNLHPGRVFKVYAGDNGERWYFLWENTNQAVSDLIEALDRAIDDGLPLWFATECSRFADQMLREQED